MIPVYQQTSHPKLLAVYLHQSNFKYFVQNHVMKYYGNDVHVWADTFATTNQTRPVFWFRVNPDNAEKLDFKFLKATDGIYENYAEEDKENIMSLDHDIVYNIIWKDANLAYGFLLLINTTSRIVVEVFTSKIRKEMLERKIKSGQTTKVGYLITHETRQNTGKGVDLQHLLTFGIGESHNYTTVSHLNETNVAHNCDESLKNIEMDKCPLESEYHQPDVESRNYTTASDLNESDVVHNCDETSKNIEMDTCPLESEYDETNVESHNPTTASDLNESDVARNCDESLKNIEMDTCPLESEYDETNVKSDNHTTASDLNESDAAHNCDEPSKNIEMDTCPLGSEYDETNAESHHSTTASDLNESDAAHNCDETLKNIEMDTCPLESEYDESDAETSVCDEDDNDSDYIPSVYSESSDEYMSFDELDEY
ncbi:hypothetical protein CDAR_304791 [Caerostris darwini]|uniref:Uncharacterized protein n=1 Tax=Caerostris darwini TaxID=1538125 RepID=A0AAV4Q4P6_9ARAC|nr:hypothetical protein CDAR_304791 [Caerostris darwini]